MNKPVSFIAYHGSVEDNLELEPNKAFYLCASYKLAKEFAYREVYRDGLYEGDVPMIYKFKGTFKNPYYMTEEEYDEEGQDSNIDFQKWVDMGVDGIVIPNRQTYYVVIDPSTIRLIGKKYLPFDEESLERTDDRINDKDDMPMINEEVDYQDEVEILLNPSTNEFRHFMKPKRWYRMCLDASTDNVFVWDANTPLLHQNVDELYGLKDSVHLFVYNLKPYIQDYDLDEYNFADKEAFLDVAKSIDSNALYKKYFPNYSIVNDLKKAFKNNGKYIAEGIVHAEMNDDMVVILKNPTKIELKRYNVDRWRLLQDNDGNYYFADAFKYTHDMMSTKLRSNGISAVDANTDNCGITLYNALTNTFYYRLLGIIDYEDVEAEYKSSYLSKEFPNADLEQMNDDREELDESIKLVNKDYADTKLITTPQELNAYLQNNAESRVVYDVEKKWYLVGNSETSIHVNLISDAFEDGYYEPFNYKGKTINPTNDLEGTSGKLLYEMNPKRFILFMVSSDELNGEEYYYDGYKYCYTYPNYCIFDRNQDFQKTSLYKVLGEPSDLDFIGDIDEDEELDESIAYAEMNDDEMMVILHNPTRKELKDNHLDDECRLISDGNNGYYFASSEWTHEQIEQKLQAKNLPYAETSGEFYYYQDNLFTTRDDWSSEEEYQEYKNDWYQSLKSMPYIVKNFGNFKVEIFKGEYLSESVYPENKYVFPYPDWGNLADIIDPDDNYRYWVDGIKAKIENPQLKNVPVNKIRQDYDGDDDMIDYDYNQFDNGIDRPIDVVKYKDQYILMDGHHRAAYAKVNGLKTIKAYVYDADKLENLNESNEQYISESVFDYGTPMIFPDPTYSEFHRIMRDHTTYGKLSAVIDRGHIYCWDSGMAHHHQMIKHIENQIGERLSDNAIWVRFKEPNWVWVSAEYFNEYDDDELDDLGTQDFEKELENNPIIKKYFPRGIVLKRFNNLVESFKKVSDDSYVMEITSYNDIKPFIQRYCSFGARGLLNTNNNKVYLADVMALTHGDMVNDLKENGESIDYDSVIQFMVYPSQETALDSEYAEYWNEGDDRIQFVTNDDIYVLFKQYNFMNDKLNKILKMNTMDDVEREDDMNGFVITESIHFNDMAYNNAFNKFEELTVWKNPSIDWLQNELENIDLRFIYNPDANMLYIWNGSKWMHSEVMDNVDMKMSSNVNIIGVLSPSVVEIWAEISPNDNANEAKSLTRKYMGKLLKDIYPDGYQLIAYT